jgi:hypothetical protein
MTRCDLCNVDSAVVNVIVVSKTVNNGSQMRALTCPDCTNLVESFIKLATKYPKIIKEYILKAKEIG